MRRCKPKKRIGLNSAGAITPTLLLECVRPPLQKQKGLDPSLDPVKHCEHYKVFFTAWNQAVYDQWTRFCTRAGPQQS